MPIVNKAQLITYSFKFHLIFQMAAGYGETFSNLENLQRKYFKFRRTCELIYIKTHNNNEKFNFLDIVQSFDVLEICIWLVDV